MFNNDLEIMMEKYSTNVDRLLSYAVFDYRYDWSKYLELGFTTKDVPALLQMALDYELYEDEDELINSAPYHAWRILGLLKAEEAILPLLAELGDDDSDWSHEEPPKIFGLIGEKAIEPLKDYLFNPKIDEDEKGKIISAFGKIVANHPECRGQCQEILVNCLKKITTQDSFLAGLIVSTLVDFDATEEIEVIREAFQQGYVDIDVVGDIEEVEIEFGLRRQRSTPRPISPKMRAIREALKRNFGAEYDDDDNPKPTKSVKIGRNEPCPCGSGKKYKKCCLS